MRRAIIITTVLFAITLAAPAVGGPSLLSRVKKLERRVNAIALLVANSNELAVARRSGSMIPVGNGGYSGTAVCLEGEQATGGGVEIIGGNYTTYHVVESRPDALFSRWVASWNTGGAPDPAGVRVWVICADLR